MKIPSWPYKKVIARLENFDYEFVRQKGSHIRMKNNGTTITVPAHNPVAKGTLRKILRDTQISLEDFLDN